MSTERCDSCANELDFDAPSGCIDGQVYGPCGPGCDGFCDRLGECDCQCHREATG